VSGCRCTKKLYLLADIRIQNAPHALRDCSSFSFFVAEPTQEKQAGKPLQLVGAPWTSGPEVSTMVTVFLKQKSSSSQPCWSAAVCNVDASATALGFCRANATQGHASSYWCCFSVRGVLHQRRCFSAWFLG